MAGDWIKVDFRLDKKSQVLNIAAALGINRFEVVGRLLAVWRWAQQNTENGKIPRGTTATVDIVADLEGFGEAMEAEKWLKQTDKGIEFPRWKDHNSSGAKERARKSSWKRQHDAKQSAGETKGRRATSTKRLPEKEKEKEVDIDSPKGESPRRTVGSPDSPSPRDPLAKLPATARARYDALAAAWADAGLPAFKPGAKSNRQAFAKAWRDAERRAILDGLDLADLVAAIEDQPWLTSQGFFDFAWILGTKDGRPNLAKILDRKYAQSDGSASGRTRNTGAGVEYDPAAAISAGDF